MLTTDAPGQAPSGRGTLSLVRVTEELVTDQPVAEEIVAAEVADQVPDQVADEKTVTEAASRGSVVLVFSPKGGAGTTVIATNLAAALVGDDGRRVCILDLDLEFGDVAILNSVSPAHTIADGVGAAALDDETLARIVTRLPSGCDAVLAPIDPAAAERIDAALVGSLLEALRARYDHVVVDTPSALTEHVLEVVDAADHHVLVTTPQLPALKSLRLLLDTLDLLGTDAAARHVVVNRLAERGGLRTVEIAEAIRTAVAVELPAAPHIAVSVEEGRPLLSRRRPDVPYASALGAFARDVIDGRAAAPARRRFRLGRKARRSS